MANGFLGNQGLGSMVVFLRANTIQYTSALKAAEVTLRKTQQNLKVIGSQLTRSVTLPITALGLASTIAFARFDSAITQSVAIMSDATAEIREDMEETARVLSREGVQSARELGQAYFFLASAGLSAKQSIAALPVVQNFATAGMFDMSQATDLLTDAQSALGLTSEDVVKNMENMTRLSDVLVKANTLANSSVEQFSKALTTKAAAALRLVNKDVEEGVAVLAAFADQGIKGELAGERLSIVMRDLQRAAVKQPQIWRDLNLQVFDAAGKMRPLADIIEDLSTAFGRMTDRQKKAAAQMLGFQDRSFSALQTLFGTSEQIRMYEKALRNAGGTTEDVTNKQLTAFSAQMKILRNNIVDVGIEIGAILAPMIEKLGKIIRNATDFWRSLNESTKRGIVIFGLLAAAVGPVLVILAALAGIAAATAAGLALISPMIIGISVAIGVAIGAFVKYKDELITVGDQTFTVIDLMAASWDVFVEGFVEVIKQIPMVVMKTIDFMQRAFMQGIQTIGEFFSQLGLTIPEIFKKLADNAALVNEIMIQEFGFGFQQILESGKTAVNFILRLFQALGNSLAAIGQKFIEVGKAFANVDFTDPSTFLGAGKALFDAFNPVQQAKDVAAAFKETMAQDDDIVGAIVDVATNATNEFRKEFKLGTDLLKTEFVASLKEIIEGSTIEGFDFSVVTGGFDELFALIADRAARLKEVRDKALAESGLGKKEGDESGDEEDSDFLGLRAMAETAQIHLETIKGVLDELSEAHRNAFETVNEIQKEYQETANEVMPQVSDLFTEHADAAIQGLTTVLRTRKIDIASLAAWALGVISQELLVLSKVSFASASKLTIKAAEAKTLAAGFLATGNIVAAAAQSVAAGIFAAGASKQAARGALFGAAGIAAGVGANLAAISGGGDFGQDPGPLERNRRRDESDAIIGGGDANDPRNFGNVEVNIQSFFGTIDEETADRLAESIRERIFDGQDFGQLGR